MDTYVSQSPQIGACLRTRGGVSRATGRADVSIPSNRGLPSDMEVAPQIGIEVCLNPLKSGPAFGRTTGANPKSSPRSLNPLKSGPAFGH